MEGFFLKKLKVAVLYGGCSSEHEVSLRSAYSVIKAMDKEKYDILPIGISKKGDWLTGKIDELLTDQQILKLGNESIQIVPNPQENRHLKIDVVFPVMHGTTAEDGKIQGLLDLAQIPYVGCDTSASVLSFDKALTKTIASLIGLQQSNYILLEKRAYQDKLLQVEQKLGYPCFVKPARQGSSVGISKVVTFAQLEEAVLKAFQYDEKVVVEEFIEGREIEVSVLGNSNPQASLPGEIMPGADFYDYDSKYINNTSKLEIPAKVTEEQIKEVQKKAVQIYQALGCQGLSRVDFFLTKKTNQFYFNEINTMPGFTSISMYPKLWEASGLPYSQLIDKLLQLALEK